MTITSSYEIDDSAQLAKRFALLATTYIDDPGAAKSGKARVPLENLFRLLEMFRYDAFADETRRGVLALDRFGQRLTPQATQAWHAPIVMALERALCESFAQVPKAQAIEELQSSLRELAAGASLLPSRAQKMKTFFTTFNATLT